MSLSSPESSGDASPPGDTLVAILLRNLETQQYFPPSPQTNNVVGHVYWCRPRMIAEIMFRFKLFFFVSIKCLYSVCILYPVFSLQSAFYTQSSVCILCWPFCRWNLTMVSLCLMVGTVKSNKQVRKSYFQRKKMTLLSYVTLRWADQFPNNFRKK